VLHGQGDPSPWTHPNIEYRGPIAGRKRSDFLRNARALLAPTVFTEPFCGMAVEAMLCGTPVVSVDYGAMTETVIPEVSGFHCHTLQDWVDGIHGVGSLDRRMIATIARNKWSLEACGKRYDKIFQQLNALYRNGWYELREISFNQITHEETPFAERLAEWISTNINPASVLDVGCGPGIYVDALRSRGISAIGIDTDDRVVGKPYLRQESLFENEDTAEVVICLEVAEHIAEEQADNVAACVAANVKPDGILIWSAAHPGQGGTGHINCQPKDYWAELLTWHGLARDEELEQRLVDHAKNGYHMGWFVQNAMVFKR
jgi:2-polyprenyl-3-methyl-5-hydroxy-6-metoxy-1,4-benzoquinol methylase